MNVQAKEPARRPNPPRATPRFQINRRQFALILFLLAVLSLTAVAIAGDRCASIAMETDFTQKNLAPCLSHPFGTDWMGRDMLARTLTGLSLSVRLGLLTATASAAIAALMGSAAAMNKTLDALFSWLIDLVMGVPHILLLILISFACGRGFRGVVIGVTLSHWMSLARVIRSEVLQLKQSAYVQIAAKLGASHLRIVLRHMVPNLLPQFLVGLVLLFPHAILHEASITFLGFGLPPEQPAVGIILSESMQYLVMGRWWLAVFPGLLLVTGVLLFGVAGNCLRSLTNPASANE